MKKQIFKLSSILFIMFVFSSCNNQVSNNKYKEVHEATGSIPELPKIDVSAPASFLNDLELSPMWKVEKNSDGSFVATARSIIGPDSPFDEKEGCFLFEFMAGVDQSIPNDYQIHNMYLAGQRKFSSFSVTVVFKKPDMKYMTLGKSGCKVSLGVYESSENMIDSGSFSELAIKLSSQHDIYVILREQGADPERRTTFEKVLPVIKELADIAGSPKMYRVEKRYAKFFNLFFKTPLKDKELKRFPGLQDRDTFYGYFRAKPNTSYNGVNIKISHPVYCPDEGTRKYSRLQKAEYLGIPYYEGDVLFFLIEDNAVYLFGEYDQRFGTFTGKESFDGTLEILNDKGDVLLKTTEKFKGWQR